MKFVFPALGLMAAFASVSAPAHAYAISLDQVMCPLEKLGEAEGEALSEAFGNLETQPSDAQIEKLAGAINTCAIELKWTEADSKFVLDFNLSIVATMGLEDKLAALDVTASDYEFSLDDQNPEALQAMLDGADKSTIIQTAVEKLRTDKGDKATEEMAGFLGAYLTSTAKSRLLAMELVDNSETDF
jgi:hypothetical protein